jgi:high-affinity nickel permease
VNILNIVKGEEKRMEWLGVLLLGFALGMKHSTDPDHVVAVTTIVSQQRKLNWAAWTGMVWGLGHTITILLIGSAIVYWNFTISPRLGLGMEFSVGVMIVILGLLALRSFMKPKQEPTAEQTSERIVSKKKLLRPLLVGLVHGMAGSAAVALLVLSQISDERVAFVYLLIFGLGTVGGMMLTTLLLGLPYVYSHRLQHVNKSLGIVTAVFSIGFGLMMMYELGIGGGLFTDNPVWTPE